MMCKFNPKNDSRRIDPCMKNFITNLNWFRVESHKILACCCGHGKYPMTIVVWAIGGTYDLVSGKSINRKKKFYKKDKQGYYYIPEVVKGEERR